MSLKKKISTVFVFSLFALNGIAHAAVEGFNIDGLIGIDLISGRGNTSTSSLGWGGRLGYHLNPTWEIGAEATTTSNSTTIGAYSVSSTTTFLMGDLTYHLPDEWNPLHFGVRLGVGVNAGSSNDPAAGSVPSTANFAYGLTGGYDFRVSQNFTIGPKVFYTLLNQSTGTLGDFQAHAAFKYYF